MGFVRHVLATALGSALVLAVSCDGTSPTGTSGPFVGTWSGTLDLGPATVTLAQDGSTVAGAMTIECQTCMPVSQTLALNGTATGNTATVSVTDADGNALPVATLTVSGTNLSIQWTASSGTLVTGSLNSITSAPPLAPREFDGTYDFSFTYPQPGGGQRPAVLDRFIVVRNGVISSTDGTVFGTVLDDFGNIRFTGPCWDGSGSATWTGRLGAQGNPKAGGEGTYECVNDLAAGGTWRPLQRHVTGWFGSRAKEAHGCRAGRPIACDLFAAMAPRSDRVSGDRRVVLAPARCGVGAVTAGPSPIDEWARSSVRSAPPRVWQCRSTEPRSAARETAIIPAGGGRSTPRPSGRRAASRRGAALDARNRLPRNSFSTVQLARLRQRLAALLPSSSPWSAIMKVLPDWLTQRVENAPAAQHRNLPEMAAMRIRMAWQKLKTEAREGDEVWAFENPSNTWKKLGRHTGYALVRKGKIVQSTIVTSA